MIDQTRSQLIENLFACIAELKLCEAIEELSEPIIQMV